MSDSSIVKKRCPAMVKEGIYDPNAQDGINFCVHHCPYSSCVIFEDPVKEEKYQYLAKKERMRIARGLYSHDVSIVDIARILRKHTRTIKQYLNL